MRVIEPGFEILTPLREEDGRWILRLLEQAGRTCYKSEEKITDKSAPKFVKMLKERGHHAMIEHFNITVKFICNRGFTHELVRHRLCSFAQESTRYCNYGKKNEITVVLPPFLVTPESVTDMADLQRQQMCHSIWIKAMKNAEESYMALIESGAVPQEARGVLPIDVKTEIIITANLREWMHIFKLRCSPKAHPSMQQLMIPLRDEFRKMIPILFDEEVKDEKPEMAIATGRRNIG